ncbi:hypothetical protein ACFXGT_12040 [Streptomyces sp. NPDC059352]|uniref:hypothetical protein n=1 Tax=Streptomyces sp. NPDC059352 TaxID=3346810 RepID=UPI0036762721
MVTPHQSISRGAITVIRASEAVLTDFQQNLVIALAGAIVGILGALAIERVKSRREPTKRLSWDAETRTAVVSTDEAIRPLLRLSYNGISVDDLSSVEFRVENTGNRVVQQQLLRFRFPEGTQVLEAAVSSRPEREWGVTRHRESDEPANEAAFAIGHLECGQSVTFRILASGRDAGKWEVVSHNPSGDVGFHERSAERKKDDREHVPAFFSLAFLLFTVPPLFAFLGTIGELAAAVVSIAFLASIAPHLIPTARALRDFLTHPPAGSAVTINGVDSSVLAFGEDAHIQDVSFPLSQRTAGSTDRA